MDTTHILRKYTPRTLRNSLRRPRVTAARLAAKVDAMMGVTKNVRMPGEWVIRSHPICLTEFTVFRHDAVQAAEMLEFIASCCNGMHFIDVGAHWGAFTLAALRFGGANARCICVEPSGAAIRILKRNLLLNDASEKVTVVRAAAGAQSGCVEMLSTGAGGADYFVVPPELRPDTVSVPQVTLSELCVNTQFTPTHVKIDVEGYEQEVLEGARDVLLAQRPILFLELHGDHLRKRARDPQSVLRLLSELGYRDWMRDGQLVGIHDLRNLNYNARFRCNP